ncbi:uncharacterized protein PV09_07663 [Verruconis gallopava]|uniref:Uncharacterized protein n=1 Tax=Verruconis gallopava TaxID=253628 RepID=A0A0D2A3E1_9PEZI|nr:uncharacterized protein PV09_07663 [Verruconis gallopava]KIW00920.1 hypothetical protein PV09_07663 [Verruconis gallopava]
MAASTPSMIINLPPPRPEEAATPSDLPGTPNSGTTTMSELSTVAIKDGHRGHLPHHHHNQPLDAERADRISRLAGLDRVQPRGSLTPGAGVVSGQPSNPPQGYFDSNNQPQIMRERSTVGSASATGSVGGRTTWASGSDVYDPDKMSEDQDVDTSSMGGFSDEGQQSLVSFGEGARTPARQPSHLGSPVASKVTPVTGVPSGLRESTSAGSPSQQDARMIDGVTYDTSVVDTTMSARDPNMERSAETSERLMRERLGRGSH